MFHLSRFSRTAARLAGAVLLAALLPGCATLIESVVDSQLALAQVEVAVVAVPVEAGNILPGHDATEPVVLHGGEMAHEAEERHRGRRH